MDRLDTHFQDFYRLFGACIIFIDNHVSGYQGMTVQLYVQAHLGHYHILTQKVKGRYAIKWKEYSSQKLMAQLKSTPLLLTYICII